MHYYTTMQEKLIDIYFHSNILIARESIKKNTMYVEEVIFLMSFDLTTSNSMSWAVLIFFSVFHGISCNIPLMLSIKNLLNRECVEFWLTTISLWHVTTSCHMSQFLVPFLWPAYSSLPLVKYWFILGPCLSRFKLAFCYSYLLQLLQIFPYTWYKVQI